MKLESQPLTDFVAIADLKFDPKNPRTISRADFKVLKDSLRRWGFVQPVVVNKRTMIIIGGNQRTRAAMELGIKRVPVVWVDLSDEQAAALSIGLNKISGEFDEAMLSELLVELDGELLELTGFTQDELDGLSADPFDEEPDAKESKEPRAKSYTTADLREQALSYHPMSADTIVEFCDWLDKKASS